MINKQFHLWSFKIVYSTLFLKWTLESKIIILHWNVELAMDLWYLFLWTSAHTRVKTWKLASQGKLREKSLHMGNSKENCFIVDTRKLFDMKACKEVAWQE